MTQVLIATDSSYVANQVLSVLPTETDRVVVTSGPAVLEQVRTQVPDLAIIDFQIGNMGGMATCLDLRLETSGGRLPFVPVILMLDRRADVFLARRSQAQGWLIKPLEPFRTRQAIRKVLAGDEYHDPSYQPNPVAVTPTAG